MFKCFEDTYKFICAGKATITLESLVSGKHFTFKIKRSDKFHNKFFVFLTSYR